MPTLHDKPMINNDLAQNAIRIFEAAFLPQRHPGREIQRFAA
jgi:hypothetical protein